MGHHVIRPAKPVGGSQGIWIDPKTNMLIGGSDPRKDGMAAGF
jgi:gamma-glutamyltranspeptidase/glutathione hydrolase